MKFFKEGEKLYIGVLLPDGEGENAANIIDAVLRLTLQNRDNNAASSTDADDHYWLSSLLENFVPDATEYKAIVKAKKKVVCK